MSNTREVQLIEAAARGRVGEVEALLRNNPGLDVNWSDNTLPLPALHSASLDGHAEVVNSF